MASHAPPSPSDGDVSMDISDGQRHPSRQPPSTPFALMTPVRVRGGSVRDRTSPLPPATPMTPNRVRANDERLLYRGQVIAEEYQRRRKRYEFQTLPESGHGTASNSSPSDRSPARYSLDQVAEAVGSFADFLYFLEDKQLEYPLMPTIISRFSELGAVIESQKRHIDQWKAKELDLAISETQQNLELIAGLGRDNEKLTLQKATLTVEKQHWEEKYQKLELELKSANHRAQDQVAHLSARINELQFQKQDLESIVKERNETIVTMEKEFVEQQKTLEMMEQRGQQGSYENRNLMEKCSRQEQAHQELLAQFQELRQQCESERQRAEECLRAAHSWEIKHQEEKRLREHIEADLGQARRERDEISTSVKQIMGEGGKFRAEFEATAVKYEHQLQTLREHLKAKDMECQELQHKLQLESERARTLTKDIASIRKQAEDGLIAMKSDLEQSFVTRVNHLREEQGDEARRVRGENEELLQRCEHLQQLNQKKSAQIAELMAAQQDWIGEGNQRLTDLTSAVGDWKSKCEELQQEIRQRDKTSAEALRKQSAEMQEQFATHVQDMEKYLERKNAECEQLRGIVKAREDELLKLREEAHTEISKWQNDCQDISARSTAMEFECGALQREVEHRKKELDLREKEIAALKQQIEAYLAPDNERNKQAELLHRERLRLEEQNRQQQRKIEELKRDFEQKLSGVNSEHLRVAEQESEHRATILSLHHEKDELQRALSQLSAEKMALDSHLQGLLEEKEVLLESLSQYERQNAELEDKARELLQAVDDLEQQKAGVVQELKATQTDKLQVQSSLELVSREVSDLKERYARAAEDQSGRAQLERLRGQLQTRDAERSELQRQAQSYLDASRAAEDKLQQATLALRQREAELANAEKRYQDSSRSIEDKWKTAVETLQTRESELLQARRQLQSAEMKGRELEAKHSAVNSELARVREWNDRYKKELELLKSQADDRERQRQLEAAARETELLRQGRGLEAEYEKLKSEFKTLQNSAQQEVRRLEGLVASQKSEFQLEHQRLVATNERLDRQSRGSSVELVQLKDEAARLRDEAAQAKSDADFQRSLLKQRDEQLQRANRDKAQLETSAEQVQATLQRVERAYEDFKRQTVRTVKEKKDVIDRLEEEANSLRAKLTQQIELKEQAVQYAQGDKNAMTTELLAKEQQLSEARGRLRKLEEQVRSLQRELSARQDTVKVAVDAEQRKRGALEAEREELRAQLKLTQEEKATLRAKLSTATDDVASLRRQLHSRADEADTAMKHTRAELATRLNSIERELHQTQGALVAERERNKQLKDVVKLAQQEAPRQADLLDKAKEVDALKLRVRQLTTEKEHSEQLHADRVADLQSNEANLIKRLKVEQQRCDASARREDELQTELADLRSRAAAERDQLDQELQQLRSEHEELLLGQSLRHDGNQVLKDKLAEERRLVRLHQSTIERKEALIRDLEARLRKLESEAAKLHEDEGLTHGEVDELNDKLTRLKLENDRLRVRRQREPSPERHTGTVAELRAKCASLEMELERVLAENDALEATIVELQQKTKKTNHTKCELEIERLQLALDDRAVKYAAGFEHHHKSSPVDASTAASSASSVASRRVRELERSVREKEKKIMMLNDHLTYLMTSSIELQHENETLLRRPETAP